MSHAKDYRSCQIFVRGAGRQFLAELVAVTLEAQADDHYTVRSPLVARGDLTEAQWAVLEPLLPKGMKPGRPSVHSKRQLINGIRFRTRTGIPWRDLPERYGPWETVYGLFRLEPGQVALMARVQRQSDSLQHRDHARSADANRNGEAKASD